MRFRLIYEGEVKSNQRDRFDRELNQISEHKQPIRKAGSFDVGLRRTLGGGPDDKVSIMDAVAFNYRGNGYRFVPLVRKDWRPMCSLNILFLRHDPPGSLVHAGDLDNRIKTLIDALRRPESAIELRGNEQLAEGEDPFFCLLEDDKLVTGLTVESDRFLKPPNGKKERGHRAVSLGQSVHPGCRGHRREQVQSRQDPRQELHGDQDWQGHRQVEASIARNLAALDRADRQDDDVAEAKAARLKEKIEGLRRQMQSLKEMGKQVEAASDRQVSLTNPPMMAFMSDVM
jgi:hypothetical protein